MHQSGASSAIDTVQDAPARRLRRMPLRVRLTLWYVALLGLILSAFSAVLYGTLARGLYQQVDDGLRQAAHEAAGAVDQSSGALTLQAAEGEGEVVTLRERGLLVRLVDRGGRVVDSTGPLRDLPVPAGALSVVRQGHSRFDTVTAPATGATIRIYSVPYPENGAPTAVVETALALTSIEGTLHHLLIILVVVVPATLIAASLGGLFLANRALAPIDRITSTAQRIGAENLTQRLNLSLPDDEVGRLAQTFDAMLSRLDDAFRRQRQFTADASHELRTPLTIMKSEISVTLDRPRPTDEYRRVLAALEEEVDRLAQLVEDLLFLARAEASQPLVKSVPLDLSELLRGVAAQLRPLAVAQQLSLCLDTPDVLPLDGDPGKLVRLFLNLVGNAVDYTPRGGEISVRATMDGCETVRVDVGDTGPGIPPNHLPHIFDRFYRADSARSRALGGAGIGLAIARSIVEAHGGTIAAQSVSGKGTTITVRLPTRAT